VGQTAPQSWNGESVAGCRPVHDVLRGSGSLGARVQLLVEPEGSKVGRDPSDAREKEDERSECATCHAVLEIQPATDHHHHHHDH